MVVLLLALTESAHFRSSKSLPVHIATMESVRPVIQVTAGYNGDTYTCTYLKTESILYTMGPTEQNGPLIRQQLDRVLSSPVFARSERLSRFLRFVVERHLEGKESELKESLVAVEVFGRKPDYDPKLDSIVRTEAGRLRARLVEYYAGEGRSDPLVIELPKGGYTPRFRRIDKTEETLRPRTGRRWTRIAVASVVVLLAAAGWWWQHRRSGPIAIAVLPLENLGSDPVNDYFADGLTDEIIRNLSAIEGLAPRSRTSSFAFKGKARDVREAGKQLQADYILEGSVLRAGQQLRINVQLVRVRDDFPLWSGKFDRELTDVFAIQDEISRGIVNQLRLNLGRGRRRYETNVEAYDLYLRARSLVRLGVGGSVRSIELFEKVIGKDSSFAPAYAGLAAGYSVRSALFGQDGPDDHMVKMRAAAEQAIRLDPLLGEAHAALGMSYARDGQWEQAEKSFRRAIEIAPSDSTTRFDFAVWLLMGLGRIEEALQQLQAAEKADPLSPEVQRGLAFVLISAGRYEAAADHCRNPSVETRHRLLGRARLGQNRITEAIQLLEADSTPGSRGFLGHALAKAGRREEAEKLAAAANPYEQVLIFAGLGDKGRVFEALYRMAPRGAIRIGQTLTFPELVLIRDDPRLKAFRKKIGLPE